MTIRTPAAAAVLTLLGLAADNRACAQPVVPRRPQVSAYQSLFYPYSQPLQYGPGGYAWNRSTGPTVPLAPGYLAGPYTGPYPAGYASPYGAPYGGTGSVFGPAYAGRAPHCRVRRAWEDRGAKAAKGNEPCGGWKQKRTSRGNR